MNRSRLSLYCIALMLLPLGAARAQDRGFGETTSVVAVEVPVYVTKDGQPVRGLTAANFEIVDGRKSRELTGFEVLDLTLATASEQMASMPVAARRHFLLLFDLSFSDPQAIVRARSSAREVVARELHPSDLAAVGLYSAAKGSSLVLGFTSDRRQLDLAIDTLGVPKLVGRGTDPLNLVLSTASPGAGATQMQTGGASDRPTAGAREEAVEEYLNDLMSSDARANRAQQRTQVAAFSQSIGEFGRMLGSIDGTKHVLFFSQGFDASLLRGEGSSMETSAAIEHGELWDVKSDEMYGDTKSQNEIERMLEELRRGNVIVQAVDISRAVTGAEQSARASGEDGLFAMARGTGGEFYRNFNDLGEALGKVLERTSVTYLLAFQPEDLKFDGSFHKLKIKLKNAPAGAKVFARPGYYAPKPSTQLTALERRLQTAADVLGGEEGGALDVAVLAVPFRTSGPSAYVPVLIEIGGPSLLAGQKDKILQTEIYAYALDAEGGVQAFFTQNVGLELAKVEQPLRQSGLKFYGDLELPPGEYTLRVMVRNSLTGASTVQALHLSVPAYAQGAPELVLPLFPEPANKWLLTREAQVEGQQLPDYPFVIGAEPFIPASKPVLQSDQAARVAVMAYNLGSGDVKAQAVVTSAGGQAQPANGFRLTERQRAGGGTTPDRLVGTFTPDGLAPGEYRLAVTVVDPATGAARTSEAVDFVVVKGQGG